MSGKVKYQVERGLDVAIGEYAPGRAIVVDKTTYIILVESGASEQLHLLLEHLFRMQVIEKLFAHVGSAGGLDWKRTIMMLVLSAETPPLQICCQCYGRGDLRRETLHPLKRRS